MPPASSAGVAPPAPNGTSCRSIRRRPAAAPARTTACEAAVLLGRSGEVRASGERRAARPDDGATLRHGGCERLVLEVAVGDPGLLHEVHDPLRLGEVAR